MEALLVKMRKTECHKCGGVYALTENFDEQRKNDGGSWSCPYCKVSTVYCESSVQRLQKQLDAANKEKFRQAQEVTDALKEAKHFRDKFARIKNRVEKGVCPHCNRYFKNVHRHMECKHKDVK
jgi:hypothetical protein